MEAKWSLQIILDRWKLSRCLSLHIRADVFWLPWKEWNPLMTAYLTFTHSVSRPLIATLHLPGVCQLGRLITNLSGGVHEGYESSAGGEIMCSVEEYGDWHERHTGLVTDDLLQRSLNGSRHDSWLGLIRAVSSEQLFHFTSLSGDDHQKISQRFRGQLVSSRWSRTEEEINCCLR